MTSLELPEGFIWAENVELGNPEVYRLSQISWPRFLLEESDMPDPILKFQISVQDFEEKFRVFGIRQKSTNLLVAFIQAVHVEIEPQASELPDLGWRFSIQNASQKSQKNAMSLIEASIDPNFRGHKLSKFLIERVKQETRINGFKWLVAPVRPTMKSSFPDESIEFYCSRKSSNSDIFDPWLRSHIEAGAVITNICHNSVSVKASLAKWQEWTGVSMNKSGPVHVEGALMPVIVDTAADTAIYTEPNVWVKYTI